MVTFISLNAFSISRETQLRALKLLKVALKNKGRNLFDFGYQTMRTRWERISKSFSSSKRFSLQELEPQYCTYFQNVTGPSPGNDVSSLALFSKLDEVAKLLSIYSLCMGKV